MSRRNQQDREPNPENGSGPTAIPETPKDQSSDGAGFSIGSVHGTGHHIGHHGTITNTVHPGTEEIRILLQELMDALPTVSTEDDEEAAQLTDELRQGRVDSGRIRAFLTGITTTAGSVTAVSDAAARLAGALQFH